jgi:hypothetical protein
MAATVARSLVALPGGDSMSRKMLWLGLFLIGAQAAFAVTRISVGDFDGRLSKLHGKPDNFVADRISSFELTQRATSARLAQWLSDFHGKASQLALITLADNSAFLELSPGDIPAKDKPTHEEQQAIVGRAIQSLREAIQRLPDFSATRDTLQFDDSKIDQGLVGFGPGDLPLNMPEAERKTHLIDKHSLSVSYVHGTETVNDRDPATLKRAGTGLTTWGEFGPILSVIFGDSDEGSFAFESWERTPSGTLAIFKYSVPQERSHYLVSVKPRIEPQYPAYQGEIAIDPETGAVGRVTMISHLEAGHPAMAASANIAVEYGPIVLGDHTYNCPVHGVATSSNVNLDAAGKGLRQVNDIQFNHYHLFRGDVRILPGTPETP